ncbi:hypothetical protein LX36DRAFT_319642 [Colletotrichum falcatum]|nr:hypothetical protein LX36DRAFT_319642 [Colletotrichum falcatum]
MIGPVPRRPFGDRKRDEKGGGHWPAVRFPTTIFGFCYRSRRPEQRSKSFACGCLSPAQPIFLERENPPSFSLLATLVLVQNQGTHARLIPSRPYLVPGLGV